MTPEACAARRFELALRSPRLRAVVLGEAPGRNSNPGVPCTGRLGQALARMLGWSFDEYLARTARANLLPAWPGSAGRGSRFDVTSARTSWESTWLPTIAAHAPTAPLLLLGTRVAAALRVRGGLLAESIVSGHRALVVPHPSRASAYWNRKEEAEARVGTVLRAFLAL